MVQTAALHIAQRIVLFVKTTVFLGSNKKHLNINTINLYEVVDKIIRHCQSKISLTMKKTEYQFDLQVHDSKTYSLI